MTLSEKEKCLREWFLQNASVIDRKTGYIDIEKLNRRINTTMQGYAADIVAFQVTSKREKITVGVPISNAGDYFGCAVAERLEVDISAGRKGNDIPKNWRNAIITPPVHSFTTSAENQIVSYGVEPNDWAIILDDFLATSETLVKLYNVVAKKASRVSCGFYVVKFFDIGPKILERQGIPYSYALGIQEIDSNDKIILRPPHYARG